MKKRLLSAYCQGGSPVRGKTKFGILVECGLAGASGLNLPYSASDFRAQCNHIGCDACGKRYQEVWSDLHALKGAVIKDDLFELLLTWPVVKTCGASIPSVLLFLDAVRTLATSFPKLLTGGLDGWIAVTEYGPTADVHGGCCQPHVHLGLLCGNLSLPRVLKRVATLWKKFGGAEVLPREEKSGGISGFLQYVRKHPLSGFDFDARRRLHKYLFSSVERTQKAPATLRIIGGPALGPQGFSKIRARARSESSKLDLRGTMRDPDYGLRRYRPTVRRLTHVHRCNDLRCLAWGAKIQVVGMTPSGLPRLLCSQCNTAWEERPLTEKRKEASRRRRRSRGPGAESAEK